MSGMEAALAMKKGVAKAIPDCEVILCPVADGGDGLTEVLEEALNADKVSCKVCNPLFEPVEATYLRKDTIAIIEMAKASGLNLLTPKQYNPSQTTTFGTGELILHAIRSGAKRVIVGLGGSATCDGGIGMASALGFSFFDKDGNKLSPVGENMTLISEIDTSKIHSDLNHICFEAICDVTNPFSGPDGASHVYSPQKGGSPEQVQQLDQGLHHFSKIIKKKFSKDISHLPGAGAAGGLGGGLHAFLGADLKKGIDLVLELLRFEEKLKDADLVLTGEGQMDHQTIFNKAPAGVALMAASKQIPCIALCGSIGEGAEQLHTVGIKSVFPICRGPITIEKAIKKGEELLSLTAEQVMRTFLLSESL